MTATHDLTTYGTELGIEYAAHFVPQHMSRNAEAPVPSLNWRITIARRGRAVSTDYQQGVGFIPDAPSAWDRTTDARAYVRDVARTGRYVPRWRSGASGILTRPLPAPVLGNVLAALLLDASVLQYTGYEDWALDTGFDLDSRVGERTYQACRDVALRFRPLFAAEEWERLLTLVQDW